MFLLNVSVEILRLLSNSDRATHRTEIANRPAALMSAAARVLFEVWNLDAAKHQQNNDNDKDQT
jgi:hypothetical protein